MSEVMTLAELRKAATTRQLTPEEATQLYGPGNPARMRYAVRGSQIVSRTFGPGEQFDPAEWKDSPTACGAAESHPGRADPGIDPTETVVGYVGGATPPAVEAPKALPPEEIAAARRTSRSTTRSVPQADFGDKDDGAAGPQE